MRFIVLVLLIAACSFLTGLLLPWWSTAAVSFLLLLAFPQRPAAGFFIALVAVFVLWFALGMRADRMNDHILSVRMGELIFHSNRYWLVIIAGALMGALPSGFAGLTACLVRSGKRKKLTSFGRFYAIKPD